MKKTILLTGATDGIGLETAKALATQGHTLLIHGRNQAKVEKVKTALLALSETKNIEGYVADFSNLEAVHNFAEEILQKHTKIDVLINNAGIFKTPNPLTEEGLDIRFVVNTLAPYLLTQKLMPLFNASSRVINLSSAAQAPVDLEALRGNISLTDSTAYAQSKLAITMSTNHLANHAGKKAPLFVSINPASFLGSKMVQEAYGMAGKDLSIGSDILIHASLSDEFKKASGKYFDNDIGQFSLPHRDALNPEKCAEVVEEIEKLLGHLDS
jgi:NAD(P)-dependent dehydrogenase (short-subunit alcohol dehydrogenase family)